MLALMVQGKKSSLLQWDYMATVPECKSVNEDEKFVHFRRLWKHDFHL
jgi:hypothetical protein